MKDRFAVLHVALVKYLCEFFIDDRCPLPDKKSFINDPLLDHLIFEIFVHRLWGKAEYEESISEFLKSETAEQEAFDDKLRDDVYDMLSNARSCTG